MTPTIRQIQDRTAEICGVDRWELIHRREAPNQTSPIKRARHIAMYVARLMTPKSLEQIGRQFDRHHTTVMYAIRQIDQRINNDADLYRDVRAVCSDWRRA